MFPFVVFQRELLHRLLQTAPAHCIQWRVLPGKMPPWLFRTILKPKRCAHMPRPYQIELRAPQRDAALLSADTLPSALAQQLSNPRSDAFSARLYHSFLYCFAVRPAHCKEPSAEFSKVVRYLLFYATYVTTVACIDFNQFAFRNEQGHAYFCTCFHRSRLEGISSCVSL